MSRIRVVRDSVKGWRVVCDLHGELAFYYRFWPAAYDCRQHREDCPLGKEDEDAGRIHLRGRPPAGEDHGHD